MFPALERNVRSVVEEGKKEWRRFGSSCGRRRDKSLQQLSFKFPRSSSLYTAHAVSGGGLFDAAAADVGQEIVTNNSGGNRTELGNSSYIAPLMSPYLRPSFAT